MKPSDPAAGRRRLAPRRSGRPFVLGFATLVAAIVLAGFWHTFIVPFVQGRFERPWFVYAHMVLFFTWVILLVVQASLATRRRIRWHQRLGRIGFALVPLMAVSGIAVSVWATRRDVALGDAGAIPFFFGQLMDMLLFAAFAGMALLMRKRPAVHKRLIMFATIAILGAAVGRIPVLGAFADFVTIALVLSIAVCDVVVDRRLQPATCVGGPLLLAGIFTETPLGALEGWGRIGPVVLDGLSLM